MDYVSITDRIKESQRAGGYVKLGIGIPHNFPMVPMAFFDSFTAMEKPPYIYLRSSAGQIEDMRNGIVAEALASGCTHVIMMDTDQVYHPETIPRLLSHKLPIVGCLVYRRYPPFDPLMFRGTRQRYINVDAWLPGELVPVDATGTGCLLINTDVFRKLPPPWFKVVKDQVEGVTGEDFYFCGVAREAGYNIYVDTSIPAGHLTQMIVNEGTWKLYNHVKKAELKQAHAIEHGYTINKEVTINGI